jgi:isopropylmalate/homocitrate/citramalate synthase
VRVELVERLLGAGLPRVEVASFVDPRAVPQMADAEAVVAALPNADGARFSGLVLNERGYERLATTRLTRVQVVVAATDSFNTRNANATTDESRRRAERILERAHADGRVATVGIAVAFGCPFEGEVDEGRVVELAARLAAAGADELTFADTIGVAVPGQVRRLVARVQGLGRPVGVHVHNTRNVGLANVYAAIEEGVDVVDASVGGTGGCPFAPGASGNVATEDVVYMLERDGIRTGVDLDRLVEAARWLEAQLGRPLAATVAHAAPFPRAGEAAPA